MRRRRRSRRPAQTLGLCPITEANLGDGLFNGRRFLQSGGHFGVGTDSNVLVDVAAELRQLEYAQRLRDRARNRIGQNRNPPAALSLTRRVEGGARALASGPEGIATGASADIVSLCPDHVMLEGRAGDRILDAWIFAARHSAINSVWVRGVSRSPAGVIAAGTKFVKGSASVMRRLVAS